MSDTSFNPAPDVTRLCERTWVELVPGGSFFEDWSNPTAEELRVWAYGDAYAPGQDFETMLDGPEVLPVVVECVEDFECPAKQFLLTSLYCTVGHLHPDDRERVRAVALQARSSHDPAVRTWGTRAVQVIDQPERMNRSEWCGFPSLAHTSPVDE